MAIKTSGMRPLVAHEFLINPPTSTFTSSQHAQRLIQRLIKHTSPNVKAALLSSVQDQLFSLSSSSVVQVISELLWKPTLTFRDLTLPLVDSENSMLDKRYSFTERTQRLRMACTVLAAALRSATPSCVQDVCPVLIHNNHEDAIPVSWPMPFQTPPHFALLITSKHDGGATLLPVSFDFIGDHERDTNSMEMFFGVSTRTQNNVQSIDVKRIQQFRNANMSWHYTELIPNLRVSGLDVQDNFFVALASRIRPIRQSFEQAGVGVLTAPGISMIYDPRTTPIPLGNLDLLVQEKYQRKQFTESRHCFRFYANIWEPNGQRFRQLSFLWKYIASLPRLVSETPCLTPFSTLPLDSIRFNPPATDQSSSASALSVAQISRSTALPMSLPLIDREPACSYFVAGRCGQPCAALTPFCAYHIPAVLRSYSNEWFAEAETTLQISTFTKRTNNNPLLPPTDFDNLATKQPHLIPKFIRLVTNDAIFYDFEFSVMNSPYLTVPLELGVVRKDGFIVVDTAIYYGMYWSDLWNKVSLYMSPELVDHQQALHLHDGRESTEELHQPA